MSSLIDMLLQGTRFDQKNNLNNRVQSEQGLNNPTANTAQPVAPTYNPAGDPEAMIRRMRAARKAQQEQEARNYMNSNNGTVMPGSY